MPRPCDGAPCEAEAKNGARRRSDEIRVNQPFSDVQPSSLTEAAPSSPVGSLSNLCSKSDLPTTARTRPNYGARSDRLCAAVAMFIFITFTELSASGPSSGGAIDCVEASIERALLKPEASKDFSVFFKQCIVLDATNEQPVDISHLTNRNGFLLTSFDHSSLSPVFKIRR